MQRVLNHIKRLDWVLIGAVALIFLLGLLTLYGSPLDRGNFYKQLIFGILAFTVIIAVSFVDYRIFQEHSILLISLYLFGLALLFFLFIVGSQVRGISAWFFIGGVAVQPVEIVKVIVLLVLAKYLSGRHVELYKLKNVLVSGLYVFLPAAMVLVQPDLGSALVLLASWLGLVIISGIKPKQFLLLVVLGLVLIVLLWNFALHPYQKNRVLSFINPGADPLGGGYQTRQAVVALGSGGFFGKGLGEGSQTRLGFLPEYQSDFMFAAIGEEWGLTGALIVLAMWLVIFWRLYKIWQGSGNNFARLFVGGFFILLFTHTFLNIGANLALLPVTGLPLPFVSYGGSNLLSFALALGLVMSVKVRSRMDLGLEG